MKVKQTIFKVEYLRSQTLKVLKKKKFDLKVTFPSSCKLGLAMTEMLQPG